MQVSIKKLVNNTGQIEGVPANPRQINKTDYERLLKSLKEDPDFLIHKPLHVYEHNDKYVVLGGNQRLRALKELGYKEVPVTVYDKTTPVETLKARIIKDNSTFGEYDFDMLGNEWSDEPLTDWGLDLPEGWLEQEPEIEEDEAPEVSDEPPVSKLGEVYQLGRHRVMCGSATEASDALELLNGDTAQLVFTDPPYGVDVVKGGKVGADFGIAKKGSYSDVIGDDTTETAEQFYKVWSELVSKHIIWGGNYFTSFLPFSDGWLIWDKREDTGIRNTFADGEMAWVSWHTPVRIYRQLWNGMIRKGESGARVHPTQKPIDTLASIIRDFTKADDIVVDVFLGSGSTLIACEQTDRTCYGMELDPKYVDVIRKRYHKFVTGSEEGWENETPAI